MSNVATIESRIDRQTAGTLAVTSDDGGMRFETMVQVMEFAKMMSIADIAIPAHLRGNPGACLAVALQAVEWKFSPFAVANKSYSVNNRLAYESQLVQAVILQRAPIKGRFKVEYTGEAGKRRCKITANLLDGESVEYVSPEFDRITPKNSPLWKSDPDQQQFYYAGRALCRRHFPDVLLGVYAKDEIEDSDGFKDVTPKSSGLADRLTGGTGGFSADHVAEALQEAQDGGAAVAGTDAPTKVETPASDKPVGEDEKIIGADAEHDPEMVRAGAQAFIDGEDRHAPDDLSPADAVAWLSGFDARKAGA